MYFYKKQSNVCVCVCFFFTIKACNSFFVQNLYLFFVVTGVHKRHHFCRSRRGLHWCILDNIVALAAPKRNTIRQNI